MFLLSIFSSLFKKKDLKNNILNSGLYFLGSILQSILALFAQPIYSLNLSAAEFGIIGYFEAIKNLFTPIFILGMTSYYLMQYFKKSEQDNKKLLFNITIFLCLFNSGTIFVGYAIIYFYFWFMKISIPLNPFAWFILISLMLENIKSMILINFRVRKQAFKYFIFSAVFTVLNVAIGLILVAVFKFGAEGRMFAPVLVSIILLPYSIYQLKKFTVWELNFKVFFSALKIAIPLVLAAYAYVPIVNIDRFYLERLGNLSELGLYNIGLTVAGYIQLTYVAMATAFEPDIFKSIVDKDNLKLFKIALVMFVPYLFLVLIFMLFSEQIISILTSGRFIGAAKYTNLALISVYLIGIYWFLDKVFIALGKVKFNLIVNITGCISAIIILYLSISRYGYIGAIYGNIIVALIMISLSSFLVYRNLHRFRTS